MVKTSFFNNHDFMPGDDPSNAIEPDDIAKIVINILSIRKGTVIDEINLSPLKKVIKLDRFFDLSRRKLIGDNRFNSFFNII